MNMTRLLTLFLLLSSATAALAANDLTGVVVDAASKPLPGAHVYIYTAMPKEGFSPLCPYCYRDCGKQEAVSKKGSFKIKSLDKSLLFNVLAVADGFEPAFARDVDPAHGPVTIRLEPRSAADADRLITGTVVDPKGKPVVGALVESNGYHMDRGVGFGMPGVEKLSITDGKGAFALRIPSPTALLDVRVTARSYAPMIERLLVPGEPRTIHVAEGAAVTGTLVKDGKPVPRARVAFVQRNRASDGYLGRFEIGTNERGQFVMPDLGPNQTYVVYSPMEGLAGGVVEAKIVEVKDPKSTTDAGTLAVVPGRRVAGKVVVPEGMTIPPHSKILLVSNTADDRRNVEIDDDGSYVFQPVPQEKARIIARLPGLTDGRRAPGRPAFTNVPAKGDVDNLEIVMVRQ